MFKVLSDVFNSSFFFLKTKKTPTRFNKVLGQVYGRRQNTAGSLEISFHQYNERFSYLHCGQLSVLKQDICINITSVI